MQLSMGKTWTKKMSRQIEGFQFEVGVLNDRPHKKAVRGDIKNYAGGPARKISATTEKATIGEILIFNMARLNRDLLREPFRERTSDIMKFTREFLKLAFRYKGVNTRRVENLLQAVVRNPILKLDYGSNTGKQSKVKGFNRHLFDTAQMFKAIRAKVIKRV